MKKSMFSTKNIIAMTLSFVILLLSFPGMVLAEDSKPDGGGTADNPYLITSLDELYWFSGLVNGTLTGTEQNTAASAKLMNDITINENVLNKEFALNTGAEFTNWTPIGAYDNAVYSGTFDGNQHKISGLYCNTTASYGGLFGVCENATIKNVVIVDSYIKAATSSGAIAGKITSCKVRGCYIEVSVDSTSRKMGAISGQTNSSYISSNVVIVRAAYATGILCGIGINNEFSNCFLSGAFTDQAEVFILSCGRPNTWTNCWMDDYLSQGKEIQDIRPENVTINFGISAIVGAMNHEIVNEKNAEFFDGREIGDEVETMLWSTDTKDIYMYYFDYYSDYYGIKSRPVPTPATSEKPPIHRVTYTGLINEIKWTDVYENVELPSDSSIYKYTANGEPFTPSNIKEDVTVYVENAYPAFVVTTDVENGYDYSSYGVLDISKPGDYTLKMNEIWEGSTSNNIIVTADEGEVNLTLDGISIDCGSLVHTAAIDINGNSDVNIIIADNSVNEIHGSSFGAGIQKSNSPSAHLEIMGNGTLNVSAKNYAAAIGSGYPREDCLNSDVLTDEEKNRASNITISGGTINASVESRTAAVIGGGAKCNANNIVISGGNLNLDSEYSATCLGGGSDSECSSIKISGGTIDATNNNSYAILGSCAQNNLEITGGLIYANSGSNKAAIGGGGVNDIRILGGVVIPKDSFERFDDFDDFDDFGGFGDLFSESDSEELKINTEGNHTSVIGSGDNDTIIIDNASVNTTYFSVSPKNLNDEVLQRLYTYTFSELPNTLINRITGAQSYTLKNMMTDPSSKLYLLTPETSRPVIIASTASVGMFKSDSNGDMQHIASPSVSISDNTVSAQNISQPCTLIVASYKAGELSNAKIISLTTDTSLAETTGTSLTDILGDCSDCDKVKVMLFDDLQGIYPLCKSAEISF